jgi:3-hydroxyacyl-[acyl-carrier-protein] dehydratase
LRRPVFAGDQLISELEILKFRTKAIKMSGKATIDGKLVAEGEFLAGLGEK